MSLAGSGMGDHPVVQKAVNFLESSQRPDGSWPIDTNLATWLTTLSVNALEQPPNVCSWLLKQQHLEKHPYTHAAPGAWAWTDLPGGVPDADDTAGAVLALHKLGADPAAARKGIDWLLGLQNSDGGIPTFCRGWGALPFDRSAPDITAHAIRAWKAWGGVPAKRIQRALAFLKRTQRPDGSWVPLWFGNQHHPNEENPTYGTSRVLLALAEFPEECAEEIALGVEWLRNSHQDSVEETALGLEALAKVGLHHDAIRQRTEWLVTKIESGEWRTASPIGFYFAKLWYYEDLYPLIFTTAALREVMALAARDKSAV
jgi:squalene-hopene/tetraprenyl-beta-curcumene cyclase